MTNIKLTPQTWDATPYGEHWSFAYNLANKAARVNMILPLNFTKKKALLSRNKKSGDQPD